MSAFHLPAACCLIAAALLLSVTSSGQAQQGAADPIATGFASVPNAARLRMFWRIFGPAWTREEIDYQMDQLKQAGIGGVMTCFTYPIAFDDPAKKIKNERFLSPAFLDTLRYAAEKAHAAGLQFGICGGTGWPFGGPTVSLTDSAQQLRSVTLQRAADGSGYILPKLREGETVLAAFCGRHDVTNRLHGDRLKIEETAAEPCQAFIAGPTFMKVKRPSLGGEGYVVDHYNRAATLRYLNSFVAPMLNAVPKGRLQTLFCDSLEVYNANWTQDLPVEFRKRRGYSLLPHLPDLFDERSPIAKCLRFDFWRTLAELAEERFARTIHTWCRARGVVFALEAYGTPPMGFTAARFCDVPWGEQYEWRGFSFSRFAASGGHLAGKPIIGAEAWTWTGIPNRLIDSLSDLKLCSDLHFLSGENELTGVDYPYSPRAAGMPGWTPYYGPVMNQNNPQWPFFHGLADYVSRCQWLLRQGIPVADVALYVPAEDAFAEGPVNQMLLDFQLRDRLASGELTGEFGLNNAFKHHSNTIQTLLSQGFNFDGIDFFALNASAKVENGRLVAGSGSYSILILPDLHGIEFTAMKKIARFCRAGGTVIALKALPTYAYGDEHDDTQLRLRSLLTAMFPSDTGEGVAIKRYGKGRAIWAADDTAALLRALNCGEPEPDVRFGVDNADATLSHVHRRVEDRDFYFVANVGDSSRVFTAEFRVGSKGATLWNPMDGSIRPLPTRIARKGYTQVMLSLPPRGATFVCFKPLSVGEEPKALAQPEPQPEFERHSLDILWHVTFEGPDAPPPVETRALTSWTQWPQARFFSGRATYTGALEMPFTLPHRALLRFTQVREAAEIQVNGTRAGAVWTYPYEIDIAPYLKPGANRLRITVANLPVNRVLGLPDPDLRALSAVYGDRFPAPEEKRLMPEPAPSGLIGEIVLLE